MAPLKHALKIVCGGGGGKKENILSTSWVPRAISQAAKSGLSPCLSIFLCPPGRSDSAARQDCTKPSPTTILAYTHRALPGQAEGACLPGTEHRQRRRWIEVAAPLELTWETCRPPSRNGRGVESPRRDSVATVPCAPLRAGGDAVGGATGAGAYRNVLPQPGARSRRAAPSPVPGPSSQPRG